MTKIRTKSKRMKSSEPLFKIELVEVILGLGRPRLRQLESEGVLLTKKGVPILPERNEVGHRRYSLDTIAEIAKALYRWGRSHALYDGADFITVRRRVETLRPEYAKKLRYRMKKSLFANPSQLSDVKLFESINSLAGEWEKRYSGDVWLLLDRSIGVGRIAEHKL